MNCECCGKEEKRENMIMIGGKMRITKEGDRKVFHHEANGKLACQECSPKELEKLFNQLKASEGQRMSQKVRK